MRTSSENVKEIIQLLKIYSRNNNIDFTEIHPTSVELAESLKEDRYSVKIPKTVNDIIRHYKAMYIGAFSEIADGLGNFKIKCSDKSIDMKVTGGLKTIFKGTISSETEFASLMDTDEFIDVLKLIHPAKISEYMDALVHTYRMYTLMFNSNFKDARVKIQIADGRMFIYYKDSTDFDMTKDFKFLMNSISSEKRSLLDENKGLFGNVDLKYERGENESCISFNTGWDKEIKEEHYIIMSAITFPEVVAIIDTLFVKYGVHDIVTKYLTEEVMTNIMYHNYRLNKKTDLEIKENLLVVYGDSNN